MNESDILNLISDIQTILAIQNESIKQLVDDNLDLKKRVEKLEADK